MIFIIKTTSETIIDRTETDRIIEEHSKKDIEIFSQRYSGEINPSPTDVAIWTDHEISVNSIKEIFQQHNIFLIENNVENQENEHNFHQCLMEALRYSDNCFRLQRQRQDYKYRTFDQPLPQERIKENNFMYAMFVKSFFRTTFSLLHENIYTTTPNDEMILKTLLGYGITDRNLGQFKFDHKPYQPSFQTSKFNRSIIDTIREFDMYCKDISIYSENTQEKIVDITKLYNALCWKIDSNRFNSSIYTIENWNSEKESLKELAWTIVSDDQRNFVQDQKSDEVHNSQSVQENINVYSKFSSPTLFCSITRTSNSLDDTNSKDENNTKSSTKII